MKYLVGFTFAITVLVLLSVINYLTNDFIPQFTVGWISCLGLYTGYGIYNIIANKN